MAAQKKAQKKKTQPQWSSDQLLIRYLLGLTLVALGVLIFLSVALSMSGAVFAGTRQICYGLAGSLAFLLPVIPIWGGVLVILSTRVKPSLRAWSLTVLMYLLALNLVNLLSTTGSPATSLMGYIRQMNLTKSYISAPDAYEAFLGQAYNAGASSRMGGGLLGMLLSWPLWKALGIVGGVIVSILALIGCAILLFHLDMKGLIAKLRHQNQQHKQEQQEQQRMLTQRELNYLRQQVALVRPQVIVLLGATAAKTLLRPDFRITREHGQWEERKGVWFLPTYHPAALLRDESKKRDAWHDLQLVMAKLKDLEAQ